MIIVITGGTKGIGREIVKNMAEEGHHLAICARTATDLEILKTELLTQIPGEKILIRQVDVRNRLLLEKFAEEVLTAYGNVDVLINNAGVFEPGKIIDELPANFQLVMETNLHSAYFLTKAFLPSMIRRNQGHVINICSVASIQAYPNGGSYAISKHALLGFGKTLREEVREFGIRVTNILPGATWTDSWKGVELPPDRLMDAETVAQVVSTAIHMDSKATMEEVIIRPAKGDL